MAKRATAVVSKRTSRSSKTKKRLEIKYKKLAEQASKKRS